MPTNWFHLIRPSFKPIIAIPRDGFWPHRNSLVLVGIPPSPQIIFAEHIAATVYFVACTGAFSAANTFLAPPCRCNACQRLTAGCPKSAETAGLGFSNSMADCNIEGATCAYLIVMLIVECPRSACTMFRGTPFIARCEANVCRRVCQRKGRSPAL